MNFSTAAFSDFLSDTLSGTVGTVLNNTIGRFLYLVVSGINKLISLAYQLFEVFSGQIRVTYNDEPTFLTNLFFENSTVAGIYWGMAIIGIVLCFAFAIIAVIRKMFDSSDRVQGSLGAILGGMFKSILLILSMNVIMTVVLNFSNVLMQQLTYVFNAGSSLTEEQRIDFTDDQFATMGRVLNTIGNYSLNPSYNSRYNLNSCFNEVRSDLLYLQQQGVFDFFYYTEDADGNEVATWQSALQSLVFAANLEEELRMDVYYESVATSLLGIMDTLNNNTAFYPLEYFERAPLPVGNIPFDRVLFLACTYNAALNDQFNVNPSHTDPLRGPYYNGQKSIYDFEQVAKDFHLIWGFNYILFFLIVYGILKEMIYILTDCVGRIYNMVMLYLIAPPIIAVTPLDGGGKMKQWITSFAITCFGIFGTVISMRLILIFAPIVIGTDLQVFSNPIMDITAKVLMIDAATIACKKASGLLTGILADSASSYAGSASSLRGEVEQGEKENEQKKEREKDRQLQQANMAAKQAKQMQAKQPQNKQPQNKPGGGTTTPTNTNTSGNPKDNKTGGPSTSTPPTNTNTSGNPKDNKTGGPTTSTPPSTPTNTNTSGNPKDNQTTGAPTTSTPPSTPTNTNTSGNPKDNQTTGDPTTSTPPTNTNTSGNPKDNQTTGDPTTSTPPDTSTPPTTPTTTSNLGDTKDNQTTGDTGDGGSTDDGVWAIPVAPDITTTSHYDKAQDPYLPKEDPKQTTPPPNNTQGTQTKVEPPPAGAPQTTVTTAPTTNPVVPTTTTTPTKTTPPPRSNNKKKGT